MQTEILNAIIHRDYSIHTEGTPVQIDFFTNRVEIHSPGSLYGRMSIEQLGIAKPDLRNPALAVMAETLTAAEHRYSGIPTMRNAMKGYGLPEPKFENRKNEFVVTLYNKAEVEKEAVNTEPVGDLLAFLSWAENTAGDCGIFGRENRFLCDAALCSATAGCRKACNDHTGKAQKQKPKVLYGSIGRLDVVLSVPIVPAHQTWTHKTMHHAVKTWCIVSMSGRFATWN